MTERQKETLDAIVAYINKHNYSPTMRELAELINAKSVSTVYSFLKVLRRKGYVTWEEEKPRTLRVLRGATE